MPEEKSNQGICLDPDGFKGGTVVIATIQTAAIQLDRGQVKPGERYCVCSKSGNCRYEKRVTATK